MKKLKINLKPIKRHDINSGKNINEKKRVISKEEEN